MSETFSEDEPENLFWKYWSGFWGTLAALASMYRSRNWLAIFLLGPLVLFLLVLPLALGIVGQFWPRPERLVNFYTGLAEQETRDFFAAEAERAKGEGKAPAGTAKDDGGESGETPKENVGLEEIRTSVYGELLYRRLLQLQDDAPNVQMMLAMKLARDGEIGQAREMIAGLAPPEGGGYPPGHNWLAIDLLTREGPLSEEDQKVLAVHLAEAERWDGTSPQIRAAYAEFLISRGEGGKAVEVLERAVQQDPSLRVMLAAVAANEGDKLKAEESGIKAEAELLKRVEANQATSEDYFNLAQLMLVREEPKRCIEYVERGLATNPENPQLFRRLASNAFLFQFQQELKTSPEGSSPNLELLDSALKADPSNPALSDELARAVSFGVQLPEEFERQLKEYLVSGKATAMLHFIIAERGIREGQLPDALKHLEIANQLAPGSPVIMNNLAVVMMLVDKSRLERAIPLIDECIRIGGPNPEFLDSKGQIFLLGEKPMEAIGMLERAIEFAPDRLDTRANLIDAYRKIGMEDMARLQEEKLAAVRKELAEKKESEKDKQEK